MHCNPTEGDLYAEHKVQRLVLNLVVDKQQRPWSVEEIERAIAATHSTVEIKDALAQLRVIGLIHEAGEVVFASQAAAHMDRLEILAI
ncbi:MAG TPA: hypothetical protein VGL54_04540 [Solirubrobacteraceae bacterium]|jgi:hypothetical protein